MSVAQLSARELGAFVACVIKCERFSEFSMEQLCSLGQQVSESNLFAFAATYRGEQFETVSGDEIEREALTLLRDEEHLTTHFGPLAYNCIANNGQGFWRGQAVSGDHKFFLGLRVLEEAANKWQEGKQRELTRKEENAAAFDDVGQLPELTKAEVCELAERRGLQRIIVATFMVNESCGYTDYHGGRTARTVVIGFGKGKRESFKQLRAAAATFGPTQHLGPGRDQWQAWAVWDHSHTDIDAQNESEYSNGGQPYYKGHRSCFGQSPVFETEVELLEWIAANPLGRGNVYDINNTSVENRENYSMGGGNYLGLSRYSGWKVKSQPVEWFGREASTIEVTKEVVDGPKPKRAKRKAKPKTSEAAQPKPAVVQLADDLVDSLHWL